MGLGIRRRETLMNWESSGQDFAVVVEGLVAQTEVSCNIYAAIEDVDSILQKLAAKCRFSDEEVRQTFDARKSTTMDQILSRVFNMLRAREAKWFIKVLLKDLAPIDIPEPIVTESIDARLPHILKSCDNVRKATERLDDPEGHATSLFQPHIGIKIGRPDFVKARSLKHCLSIINHEKWAIEEKFDGEYCQVHIDLQNPWKRVKLFSKSGRESTKDRAALHSELERMLTINGAYRFKSNCILEGEMLVFDRDDHDKVLPFEKIRKHVSRSGSFIGTTNDSPVLPNERLGILFYDALMIDDDPVLLESYEERRRRLSQVVVVVRDRTRWGVIDFAKYATRPQRAIHHLMSPLAKATARRCEGLVLKQCKGPYIPLGNPGSSPTIEKIIKLKKDYIPGLGDCLDFCIIGASFSV